MASAAACPSVQAEDDLHYCLDWRLVLNPHSEPPDVKEIEDLTVVRRDRVCLAGEFRNFALPGLGERRWIRTHRGRPQTKGYIKMRSARCTDSGELAHLRQLAGTGSESADIFTELGLTRSHIREAMRLLQDSHSAQETLASIFRVARLRNFLAEYWFRRSAHVCREMAPHVDRWTLVSI